MFSGVQRSKNILARVRALMGQTADTEDINDMIFALATAKQIDIAETLMCVEAHLTLAVVAGTTDYDLTTIAGAPTGFFRKKLIAPPLISRATIKEIDVNEWDFYVRYTRVSTGLPIWYVKIFEGTLSFYPTPTTTENWTIYFYKSPTTTISKTVPPETPSSFDTAIATAVAAQLWASKGGDKQAAALSDMYEREFERGVNSWRARKTETMIITHEDI